MAEGSAQERDTQQNAAQQGDQGTVDPGDLSVAAEAAPKDDEKSEQEIWSEIQSSEQAALNGTDDQEAAESQSAADESGDDDAADAQAASDEQETNDGKADDDAQSASQKGDEAAEKAADAQADKAQKDIWADASPELRDAHEAAQKEIERLQQANRSNNSRVSALNRKLNDMRSRGTDASKSEASGDQRGKQEQAAKSFLDDPEVKEAAKEYPEVAGPLLKIIGDLEKRIGRHDERTAAADEDAATQSVLEETRALEKDHADWREVAAEDGFGEWLNDQPRHIQQAAIDNAEGIVDAREAADVIGRYKAFRSEQADSQQETQTSRQQQGSQDTGNSLSDRRRRQLDSSSTSRSKGPGAATGIPEDGDEQQIWDAFSRKDRQESRAVV